jgi:beta-phosphoglucomutase
MRWSMKGYIFDLDGVLVDTAKYHFLAWKRLASQLGIDFTIEDNEKLKGVSRKDSFEIILSLGGREIPDSEKEGLMDFKNKWYLDYVHSMDHSEILEGVEDYLKHLKEKGAIIILGSSSKNARLILEKVKLINYFDYIVDGNIINKAKPDPEVFLKGASLAGINPNECIVFEDAQAGIDAAKAAGMKVAGVVHSSELNGYDVEIRTFKSETPYLL